jgi:hypothetical protein
MLLKIISSVSPHIICVYKNFLIIYVTHICDLHSYFYLTALDSFRNLTAVALAVPQFTLMRMEELWPWNPLASYMCPWASH